MADRVMTHCQITNHLHPDMLLGIPFILIPIANGMGFCHGQILIGTETDSLMGSLQLMDNKVITCIMHDKENIQFLQGFGA